MEYHLAYWIILHHTLSLAPPPSTRAQAAAAVLRMLFGLLWPDSHHLAMVAARIPM